MFSRIKTKVFLSIFFAVVVTIIGFGLKDSCESGYVCQPWEGMAAIGWSIAPLSIILLVLFDFIKHFKAPQISLPSGILHKKYQEEMLLISNLRKEGIITQEEYDKKIAELKKKSGF